MRTDEELAKLSLKDDKAFAELVSRYLKRIYNFVYRYVQNRNDAEDIAQGVFIKAWKNIKKFNPDRKFKVWLFVIAKNTAFDWLRKKRPLLFSQFETDEGENPLIENLEDTASLPPEIFAKKELEKELEIALKNLNPIDRAILTLHYSDELTFEEISEILGKPMNTVKSRHQRAILKLRTYLMHQK